MHSRVALSNIFCLTKLGANVKVCGPPTLIPKKLLDDIGKDIVIMHPGPINRGVELASDVADSDRAIILDQVENGVAVRMAVLYLLAGNRAQ